MLFSVWFFARFTRNQGGAPGREVKERELIDLTRGHGNKILKKGQQVFAK
jgi:hypothetical protein